MRTQRDIKLIMRNMRKHCRCSFDRTHSC